MSKNPSQNGHKFHEDPQQNRVQISIICLKCEFFLEKTNTRIKQNDKKFKLFYVLREKWAIMHTKLEIFTKYLVKIQTLLSLNIQSILN